MAVQLFKKPSMMSRRVIFGTTVGGAMAFFIIGIIFWGGFNTAMEATNNLEFCISCHEMRAGVYQEYKPTIHYSNRTGVRTTCSDCHVPDPWVHKVVRKLEATKELYHKIIGSIDTPEKFNAKRLQLARNVWRSMKSTNSRECRNCHNFESMNPELQKPRARKQHLNAFKSGQTCIDCHKGIAHQDVRKLLSNEELEKLEAPNPAFIREIPQLFIDGLKRIEAKELEQKMAKQEAKKRADAARIASKEAEKARIDKAVADALAIASGAATVVSAASSGIDWSGVPEREITIFYPGEASMEWMMTGKDHGGSRPFLKAGDRCVTCHDKETAEMGRKIVTGEKAESTPIPGKRGSIPVKVQATHDASNLYLRFEWEDGPHVPVPFAEGGKMDPENPMKLAVMFATDEVEYADRTGCWSTCHHDASTMPHTPEADVLKGSPVAQQINLSSGVTKYLKESRTKIEVQGRRGKKRGGWDKLKGADELKAELDAGRYMDLLRYKSGQGEAENGYILEQRIMSGGASPEVDAKKEGNTWVVVMKRPLKSGKPGDLDLALDQVYNMGFAIHDDFSNSRFHHVSLGYKLGFDNEEKGVEINATAQ